MRLDQRHPARIGFQPLVEHRVLALAVALGFIHRHVRMAQQRVGPRALVRRDRNADAGTDKNVAVFNFDHRTH